MRQAQERCTSRVGERFPLRGVIHVDVQQVAQDGSDLSTWRSLLAVEEAQGWERFARAAPQCVPDCAGGGMAVSRGEVLLPLAHYVDQRRGSRCLGPDVIGHVALEGLRNGLRATEAGTGGNRTASRRCCRRRVSELSERLETLVAEPLSPSSASLFTLASYASVRLPVPKPARRLEDHPPPRAPRHSGLVGELRPGHTHRDHHRLHPRAHRLLGQRPQGPLVVRFGRPACFSQRWPTLAQSCRLRGRTIGATAQVRT